MSILNNSLLLGADAGAAGYEISRSLRFNSSDSAFLSRTPSSSGNRRTWTWAAWVKRSSLATGDSQFLFSAGSGNRFALLISTGNNIEIHGNGNVWRSTTAVYRDPSAWFHLTCVVNTPDSTEQNRIRLYVNGSEVTTWSTNSAVTQNTDFDVNSTVVHNIARNVEFSNRYFDGYLADIHFIDGQALTPSSFTEVSATTGQLIPKAYSGSFGTNGFWLKFSDNSAATATTLGKDYSGNSNNWTPNNFAVGSNPVYSNGLTTNGSKTGWFGGTPAQAFDSSTTTFVQGALGGDVTFTPATAIPVATQLRIWADSGSGSGVGSSGYQIIYNGTTIYNQSAMWTSPYTISAAPGTSLSSLVIDTSAGGEAMRLFAVEVDGVILVDGAGAGNDSLVDTPSSAGTDTGLGGQVTGNYCTWNPLGSTGATLTNGNLDAQLAGGTANVGVGTIGVTSGKWYWEVVSTSSSVSELVGICDLAASSKSYTGSSGWGYWSYNGNKLNNNTGVSYGSSWTTGDVIGVALNMDAGEVTFYKNGVSQGVAYNTGLSGKTIAPMVGEPSGSSTRNYTLNAGARPFAYTAPSGFKALCDTNLPAPVVAKPSDYFQTVLYTGNGGTQTITTGFSPDFVWVKSRSEANTHNLYDIIRGTGKELVSNTTASEVTYANSLTAFNSTGFDLGNASWMNGSAKTYVAWTWDAGSSTVTNTQGSITSQVRANPSAGFSIVTYTGNSNSSKTIGHGLNAVPSLMIVKCRTAADGWVVYHKDLGNTSTLQLQSTNAIQTSDTTAFASTTPTSTVFTVGNSGRTGDAGRDYVAYLFSPLVGYNSISSYVGNGSSDGVFVYTGHRTRWLMIKRTDASDSWQIMDAARSDYNVADDQLYADLSNAEGSTGSRAIDFLSNGFKVRGDNSGINANGGTYVYVSFAESPFQYARAR